MLLYPCFCLFCLKDSAYSTGTLEVSLIPIFVQPAKTTKFSFSVKVFLFAWKKRGSGFQRCYFKFQSVVNRALLYII